MSAASPRAHQSSISEPRLIGLRVARHAPGKSVVTTPVASESEEPGVDMMVDPDRALADADMDAQNPTTDVEVAAIPHEVELPTDEAAKPQPVDNADSTALSAYLRELRKYSLLSRDEEKDIAVLYKQTGDPALARRLITANLRLVVKIAQDYRRAHRNLLDLIQEGNVGLLQAVRKYDPYRGVKLSSYAAWWIRAYILKFILENWRMVKIGTTQAQRKLFFNLRKERQKLENAGFEADPKHLAAVLDVSEQDVVEMERRMACSETSLDSPVRSDDGNERTQADFIPAAASVRPDLQAETVEFDQLLKRKLEVFGSTLKDRDAEIFQLRIMTDEPLTLTEMGDRYGVTRERVRQIEERLKKKLRRYLEEELGEAVSAPS